MIKAADQIDEQAAWAAVKARDRSADGRFVTGVLTTGIYCRPSCPARHPARANVRFFADADAARAAGLRPCLRCRPDAVARDVDAVAAALRRLAEAEQPLPLATLAAGVGYAPHHFQKLFRKIVGMTPAAYARRMRAERLQGMLTEAGSVTDAIYDAGYSGPSRFYADGAAQLGMVPSAWRNGGAGAVIRWARGVTSLGPVLLGGTERGICWFGFGDDPAPMRARFAKATLVEDEAAVALWLEAAIRAVETPGRIPDLPLDVQGTAFRARIWEELRRVPAGEVISYGALATRAGAAGAVRAAGSACGANPVMVLIPCHRARRADGSLGGYAYGQPLKQALLDRERDQAG